MSKNLNFLKIIKDERLDLPPSSGGEGKRGFYSVWPTVHCGGGGYVALFNGAKNSGTPFSLPT
jgi:hypothetical protein